jgi:hypothetical protein
VLAQYPLSSIDFGETGLMGGFSGLPLYLQAFIGSAVLALLALLGWQGLVWLAGLPARR